MIEDDPIIEEEPFEPVLLEELLDDPPMDSVSQMHSVIQNLPPIDLNQLETSKYMCSIF